MKKYFALLLTLLLIVVPFAVRAEDDAEEPIVVYDDEYFDEYEDDYDDVVDYDVEDYYDEEDYYYYDDSYAMEADGELDLDGGTEETCKSEKLFTASNIIFLASGIVAGVGLTLIIQKATGFCCKCECDCKEEKKEKKTTKKNDK